MVLWQQQWRSLLFDFNAFREKINDIVDDHVDKNILLEYYCNKWQSAQSIKVMTRIFFLSGTAEYFFIIPLNFYELHFSNFFVFCASIWPLSWNAVCGRINDLASVAQSNFFSLHAASLKAEFIEVSAFLVRQLSHLKRIYISETRLSFPVMSFAFELRDSGGKLCQNLVNFRKLLSTVLRRDCSILSVRIMKGHASQNRLEQFNSACWPWYRALARG